MHATYKIQNPTILVIFGITGDLAHRKLLPALFDLFRRNLLPPFFTIVGFSRREMSREELEGDIAPALQKVPRATGEEIAAFLKIVFYTRGMFEEREGYEALAKLLGKTDNEWRVCANKLFYLAVPPEYYKDIFTHLDGSGLTAPCGPEEGWTRVVVEKPFGKDAKTAEELDMLLGKLFREDQIYRIDHYLGKETVQNIVAFRFSNDFLRASWDNRSVERIEIKLLETLGAEDRGAFLDAAGALRDVGQNHLLQLLALFTMEHPGAFDAGAIRRARAAMLKKLIVPGRAEIAAHTVRGQYEGYTAVRGVAPDSDTETYFRITASLDAPQWKGVPIVLEGGKKLEKTLAEAVIVFTHHTPCLCPPEAGKHFQNILRYRIQPDERISISLWVKRPGFGMVLEEKDFSFDYRTAYAEEHLPDPHVHPYRKLLLDVVAGNQTLFVSTDEVKASWRFIDPIVEAWQAGAAPLIRYKAGEMPLHLPAEGE